MEPERIPRSEPKPDLTKIVRHLHSRRKAERAEAEAAIAQLDLESTWGLPAAIERELRRRRHRLLWTAGGIAALIMTLQALFGGIESLVLCFFLAGPLLFALATHTRQTQTHQRARHTLAGLNDIRAVWQLAEATWFGDPQTGLLARQGLTRLLPRLQASDGALLNEIQRAYLYFAFQTATTKKDTEFIRAVLKALEQIGDTKAIGHVERLAKSTKINEIREAAEACLPYLYECQERERIGQTLLRPSAAPDDPADVLLRPAGSVEADPSLLLRPTGEES